MGKKLETSIWGLGFRVLGVWVGGLRVQGSGVFKGFRFRAWGSKFYGVGFRFWGWGGA